MSPVLYICLTGVRLLLSSAEILDIFKVSKVGKVAGSKVIDGEILNDANARVIRDGTIIYNGKIIC